MVDITDDGYGISEEERNELKKSLKLPLNKRSNGTDLSMKTISYLLQIHNGNIEINHQPGIGSHIMVEIPCDNKNGEFAGRNKDATNLANRGNVVSIKNLKKNSA